MILAVFALVFGFILMWIAVVAHRHAGARGARRAQARRAGRSGLQPGGVRRHRTRRAAARIQLDGRTACANANGCATCSAATSAARSPPRPSSSASKLGGEERHVAVIFVDIIGSTQLVTEPARRRGRRTAQPVLRRRSSTRSTATTGWSTSSRAMRRWPCSARRYRLDNPEDEALAAARAMAERLRDEVPECQAGIGVAAGQVVAGNVGAKERFEYTVIGEPVNEAARLCELAKNDAQPPGGVVGHRRERDRKRTRALDFRRHGDPARPRRADPAGDTGVRLTSRSWFSSTSPNWASNCSSPIVPEGRSDAPLARRRRECSHRARGWRARSVSRVRVVSPSRATVRRARETRATKRLPDDVRQAHTRARRPSRRRCWAPSSA